MTNAKVLTKKLLSCLLCLCLVLPLFSSAFVPLAAELKAALTVESSAASTADLSTVQYTSGGYHYYYYQSGATFVSGIDARSKGQLSTTNLANKIKDAGNYYPNDEDLNDGAGGKYIKFGFAMSTDPTIAYTKMAISTDKGQGDIGSSTSWPAFYRFATSGATYNVTWEKSHSQDLNEDGGGAYLYFCNTHDTRVGKPLTFIYAHNTGGDASSNAQYARYLNNSAYADLNQDAGGDYIYLVQEDGAQSNRACHDNHKYVNTTGTTDVSEALQQLQNTYNQYNNYYVTGRYTTATYNALGNALNEALTIINDYSDFYSSTYTAANMSSVQQKIINAANALATNVYYDATTNGGTTTTTSAEIVIGTNDSGSYQHIINHQATKDGWTYSGWSLDKNAITGGSSLTVGYNTTVYAIFYKTVTFQFTYLTATGSATNKISSLNYYNTQATGTVTSAAGVDTITKNGATFTMLGYRDDKDATNVVEVERNTEYTLNAADVSGSYNYYAIYERNDHTLSFDANSGTGAPAALTATQYLNASGTITSNTFTIPTTVPTREGYDFQGWGETKTGAAAYQPGATITLDANKTLYAIWEKTAYTITFDTNGGSEIADKKYDTESNDYLNEVPTKAGYTFNTWIAENATGTWVNGNSYLKGTPLKGMMGNVTLVAQWSANTNTPYTVYHMNQKADGSGYDQYLIENFTGITDTVVTLADFVKTQTGFSVASMQANGAAASTATIAPDGSLAIHIYYDRESFTVTATAGNGIDSVTGAGTYLYGAEVTLTANVKDGYSFSGWTGTNSGSETTLKFTVTGNADVTATADVVTYTISYNAAGGTLKGDYTTSYTVNDVITLPNPVRDGYDFAGWNYEQDGTGTNNWNTADLSATATTVGAGLYGDVILYATWTAKTYTITFDADGGAAVAAINYTIESTDKLPTPAKHGYVPQEWVAVEAEGNWVKNAKYSIGSTVNGKYGNVTLKAVYSQIPYTLSFNAAGGAVSPTSIIYSIEGNVTYPANGTAVLATPTRPGYTFGKWVCTEAWADENDVLNACDWVVGTEYEAGMSLVGIAGNAKFEATWTANKYDVTVVDSVATFNGVTGEDVVTAGVDYTATVSVPVGYKLAEGIIVKIGTKTAVYGTEYTYTSEDGFVTATLTIKGNAIVDDITITPVANIIDYTITYVGVNAGHGFPATYNIASDEIVIGKPSRSGYRFTGWTGTGIDGTVETITITTDSTGNLTFTANWVKEYTITFQTAGGTAIAPFKYIEGEDVVVPTPAKDGYKFLYWTATGAWTDAQLAPGTYSGRKGDATLTAVYAAATSYNVEEYFMGTDGKYGTPKTTVIDQVYVGDTVSAAHGTYEGFTADVDASILSGTVVADGKLTLKLYYTRNQYTVYVDADENIASVEGVGKYYYGQAVTLKAIPKDGYRIEGWYGDYMSDEAVIGFTIGLEDVELRVKSEYIIYTIDFVVDGAEAPASIKYNPTEIVTLPELAKPGYDMFWYVSADEGAWQEGNMKPGEYANMHGDVILNAVWVARTDTPYVVVEYFQNIEDDEFAAPVVNNLTGTTDTPVAPPKVYEGFTAPAASDLIIAGKGNTVVRYYYTRNSYTVTYTVNGIDDIDTYKYAQAIVKPADPAIGGYKFNGWDKEIAATMPAENLAYTANMSLINYTITFSGAMGSSIAPITYNVTQPVVLPQITEPGYSVSWGLAADSGSWTAGAYAPGTYAAGNYGNLALKATNIPNPDTKYIEKIVLQNVDSTYAEAVEVVRFGTTGAVVAAPEAMEGFIAPAASKLTIKGDGSTVVTYTYNRSIYSVTYDVMGETTVDQYFFDADIVAPADPAVDGYNFLGWDYEIAAKMPANDLTYTAKFEAIEYTITFDANGGSDVASAAYTIEDTVTPEESKLANFHFDGWQVVVADGNWTEGEILPESFSGKYGDISVKAVWSEKKADYKVETYYMGTDGNYGAAADVQTFNGLVGDDAEYVMPEVVGFTADAASVLKAEILEDGSTVLKAYYSRNKYTVTTSVEGNGTITATADYYYGATVEITVDAADNYVVEFWTGVEATGNTASFTMPAEAVEIKAVVVPVVYTYSFDGEVVEYTVEDTITVPGVSKGGYKFTGWSIKTADGNWSADELVVGAELNAKYGNVVIVSTWEAKVYSFAYDVNGGEMPETFYTPAGEYTATTTIVLPAPSMTGYRFAGWVVTKTDADDCNWADKISSKEDNIGSGHYGNVTLVAQWTALDVEVFVEHYLQYTFSDEYILLDKYTDYHKAGAEINIEDDVAKKHEGAYHFVKALVGDEEVETVVVNADGSTSIKLYYDLDVHKVTVNYVTPDGVEAPEAYVGEFRYGQNFNIVSPKIEGYKPSSVTYAGRMDVADLVATISYEAASYEVVVNYKYANGKIAGEPVKQTVAYGAAYSITSPVIAGYTPSVAVVEGTMEGADVKVDVIYGINTHTLTINYVYADGSEAAAAYVADLEFGYAYNVKSADVAGHTASSPYVSGTMPDEDATVTVTYTPITYTVTFVDYDGTELSTQRVVFGNAATAPAAPTRANDDKFSYEFKGWSADFSSVSEDMTITAEYIATNLQTGETTGDEEVDDSFFGKIKAFFLRLIRFFKILFIIT